MLINGQCLRSLRTLEKNTAPYDNRLAALMGQENAHALGHSGAEPGLPANDDTASGCMARVDQLLCQYNELVERQKDCGMIATFVGGSSAVISTCCCES
jgi:hypothetical protein